ncbi:patatin-like phospholipase family protein [Runella zeae]|uniref:patatin-like phospholipase family protein n=1 Tax=Runella zeae TaxID=94255 RepID=UPI0003FBF57A|nr:patatin-like phospholipase family protein [Runella zeae]
MKTQDKTFHIGLCMAGAISAGAYTAGVMDYLLEALDRWEEAKKFDLPDIPQHTVVIDVLAGTSAGGMTAPIALAALSDQRTVHVNETTGGYQNFTAENKLYEAWVKLIADDMLRIMLSDTDFAEHGATSIFNSDFIDQIAHKIINISSKHYQPLSEKSYIAPEPEVCLTLSNLTGMISKIFFQGADNEAKNIPLNFVNKNKLLENDSAYISYNHRDYALFRITDNAYKNDGRIPVSFKKNASNAPHLKTLRDSAMATGAFPIGLRWRKVSRKGIFLNQNPLIGPPNKKTFDDEAIIETVNTDGGMLNNEPFDVTKKLLTDRNIHINSNHQDMTGTVLMIDPFPSTERNKILTPKNKLLLREIIGGLYEALRMQPLFKEEDLIAAEANNDFSRFLIAPVRYIQDEIHEKIVGAKAVSSGALGGFSGFLRLKYRTHDFQLGRLNCQRFLQNHFKIPHDTQNPCFEGAYSQAAKKNFLIEDEFLPIIPDIDPATGQKQKPEPFPEWPADISENIQDQIDSYEGMLADRIKLIWDGNTPDNIVINLLELVGINFLVKTTKILIFKDLQDHRLISDCPPSVDIA